MAKKKFKIDVWDCYVTIVTTHEECAKAINKSMSDIESYFMTYFDGRNALIYIDYNEAKAGGENDLLRIMSHESNHAAYRILDDVGVKVSVENQEALCYTQDLIFGKVAEFIFKKHGRANGNSRSSN